MSSARPKVRHPISAVRYEAFPVPAPRPEYAWAVRGAIVESLACGHEVWFDLEGGWYHAAATRLCQICADGSGGRGFWRTMAPWTR